MSSNHLVISEVRHDAIAVRRHPTPLVRLNRGTGWVDRNLDLVLSGDQIPAVARLVHPAHVALCSVRNHHADARRP